MHNDDDDDDDDDDVACSGRCAYMLGLSVNSVILISMVST